MGAQSTVLQWDLLRSIASSAISGTYALVGTAFTYPARIVKILNNTTEDITVSIDGTNNYDYIPAGGYTLYDAGTNRGNSASEANFPQGTAIYVKGTAGTGNVYVVVIYAYSSTQVYNDL
jgi:hypothetical protein